MFLLAKTTGIITAEKDVYGLEIQIDIHFFFGGMNGNRCQKFLNYSLVEHLIPATTECIINIQIGQINRTLDIGISVIVVYLGRKKK